MINFPAPEEVRTYPEYVKLFRQRNPGTEFKEAVRLHHSGDVKAWFQWCWQQPEAEAIHAAYRIAL